MSVTINLVSDKENIIDDFLKSYFQKDMMTDKNTCEWSYTFQNPLDSATMIGSIMDNTFSSLMDSWISLDSNVFIKIRENNYNDIIKYIFNRFYKAS